MRVSPLHTPMAEGDGVVNAVDELLDTPGGEILVSLHSYLRKRMKMLAVIFCLAFMVTFPLTKRFISWLIDETRLPENVEIIVISPVEFILLQVQLAAQVGLLCMVITLVADGSWRASKNRAVRQRLAELKVHTPRPNSALVLTLLISILLLIGGVLYAWNWLIPMLLEYLTNDAQAAGLSTEWRLTSYTGFIANLAVASGVGFQAPLVTLLILRMEIVRRRTVRSYRRHIWFSAFLLGAFLSPPDPLSLFLVAMPVIVLFEAALILDTFTRQEH